MFDCVLPVIGLKNSKSIILKGATCSIFKHQCVIFRVIVYLGYNTIMTALEQSGSAQIIPICYNSLKE